MNCEEILAGVEASGLVKLGHLQTSKRTSPGPALDYQVSGFSICATRGAGFDQVLERFPWYREIMARIKPATTAIYLTVNVAIAGSKIAPHRDGCLPNRYVPGMQRRAPEHLTIAYVCTQDMTGGALIVDGNVIEPFEGMVVEFPGNLEHEVEEVTFGRRVSIILEEYALSPEELAAVPAFDIP